MPREIKILSACFFVIFLAYNGVQQFLTAYFAEIGVIQIGFWSLILIYSFLLITNFFSGFAVARLGAKKSLILGSLFYAVFIFTLALQNTAAIYLASALLGCAASLLWTAQGVVLVRLSDKNDYGKNSGFFSVLFQLGSAIGVILFGFAIAAVSFRSSFLIFGVLSLVGIFFLLFLQKTDPQPVKLKNNFSILRKVIVDPKILQLFLIWFSFSSVIALTAGQFPIEVKKIFGIRAIGFLTPFFYLMPIIFSYYMGKASDIKGRRLFLIIADALIIIGLVLLIFQLFSDADKILFILSFFFISLGYAVYAPLRFALMGDVSDGINLESLAAVSVVANNLGYVMVFLINLYLPLVFSYSIPLVIILLSSIIVLPMLRLNKA